VEFEKYHGGGNDFILIDELEKIQVPEKLKNKFVLTTCHRHLSVGADGVVFLQPSEKAMALFRHFDPDGREIVMCGNGLRCAGAYLIWKLKWKRVIIETKLGLRAVEKLDGAYRTEMGKLAYLGRDIREWTSIELAENEPFLNRAIEVPELGHITASFVYTGEPHLVILREKIALEDLNNYGEFLAKNKELFPFFTNVNLIEYAGGNTLKARTYERGLWYETMACGTGACAVAAAAYLTGLVPSREIKVITKSEYGFFVEISEDLHMHLTAPAERVFRGELTVEL